MEAIEKVGDDGASFRLILSGRMTFSDHIQMKRITRKAISSKYRKLVIDLSALDFMDSAAIGMLLIVGKELSEIGGEVVLENPKGQFERVFATTRLNELLTVISKIGTQR